ncbi:PAN domain containing protein [Ophiocordyceps sinensis CO18]|uniref:PAN domain containing protein n=1 Tax=Ophiocordyceps sinensis (strain Co18 / CGMCC 3.14243) TaxID=911162 RepID=T5ADX7_OPHSC|nr:PAN domain containing protein [Ophiocordyceps sinensis CO18]
MRPALSSLLTVHMAVLHAGLGATDAKYACPRDNGQTFISGGDQYELKCDQGVRGMPVEEKECSNMAACAERCAANKDCLHSTWIEKTGKCALKKTGPLFELAGLSTWFFVASVPEQKPGEQEQPTDSSQKPLDGGNSGSQATYTCPAHDKKTYTTNGIRYELLCDTGHRVTHWRDEPCPSLTECADRCAKDPACYSCDYNRKNAICFFKKTPSETTPWTEGDAWYPVSCPDARETQASKDPGVTTSLQCPQGTCGFHSNGKTWEASDGTWFYLQCCTDTEVATVVEQGTAMSHRACLDKCVVSYNSTTPVDNCRLYGNLGFSTTKADGVHYAFVAYPPTKPAELTESKRCSTECPYANGQLFVGASGENFLMSCHKRHGTTYLHVDGRESLEACMTACSVMPQCRSVDFEARTKRCFHGNSGDQPSTAAGGFVSAHSLGCSGGCAARNKGGEGGEGGESEASKEPLPAGGGGAATSNPWPNDRCQGANWMASSGCHMHPGVDKNGHAPVLKARAECDSVTPLTRSLAGKDFQ